MSGRDLDGAMAALARASRRRFSGLDALRWPAAIPPDAWCFSPDLISIQGTEAWAGLGEPQRRRLALFEAVNFFSLNVHGEKRLIAEVVARLHGSEGAPVSEYLGHFVEEEAKHIMHFAGFCARYAGGVYPDRTVALAAEPDPEVAGLLLFARIFVFEEIVDEFNRRLAADTALAPIVRAVNRLHHADETRHLAFGRLLLARRSEVAHRDAATLERVRAHLAGYLDFVWQQFHCPQAYRDAGLGDPIAAWRRGLDSPATAGRRRLIERGRLGVLRDLGLLEAA